MEVVSIIIYNGIVFLLQRLNLKCVTTGKYDFCYHVFVFSAVLTVTTPTPIDRHRQSILTNLASSFDSMKGISLKWPLNILRYTRI